MRPFVPRGPKRYAHQTQALRKIIKTRGVCALLMDPGVGKTMTTVDYVSVLALKAAEVNPNAEIRVLVIAPLAAVDTWVEQPVDYTANGISVWAEVLGGSIAKKAEALGERRQGGRRDLGLRRSVEAGARAADGTPRPVTGGPDSLGPGPRVVYTILNTDAFQSRHAAPGRRTVTVLDLLLRGVESYAPDLIVLDESHRAKGHSSNTSRALARLTKLCRRRLILTGTVMPHSPLDVYGQWRFLEPEAFGTRLADGTVRPWSFGQFESRYAVKGGYMGQEVTGFKRLDEMHEIMARNSFVADKDKVLDLPPTQDITVPVHLSPAEQRAYDSMKKDFSIALAGGSSVIADNPLTQGMRLRQITSGFTVDDTGAKIRLGDSRIRVARSLVNETLAGEKRVVVFAHLIPEVAALSLALQERGTEVIRIDGSTPNQDRIRLRRRFGSDAPERIVMVAQARTMSVAVNELVTASHAVFCSLSERREDWEQARARLDRSGQTRPVTYWNLLAPKSVDGAIIKSHRTRTSLEESILDHISGRLDDE